MWAAILTFLVSVSMSASVSADTPTWPGSGDSSWNASPSCSTIIASFPTASDGVYWVNAYETESAFQAYCDMTTDGGWWTLVMRWYGWDTAWWRTANELWTTWAFWNNTWKYADSKLNNIRSADGIYMIKWDGNYVYTRYAKSYAYDHILGSEQLYSYADSSFLTDEYWWVGNGAYDGLSDVWPNCHYILTYANSDKWMTSDATFCWAAGWWTLAGNNISVWVKWAPLIIDQAPTASNTAISWTLQVWEVLTWSYDYADTESNPQWASTFRWLSSSAPTWTYTEISWATSLTYTLEAWDTDNYIKFEVTPVASAWTTTWVAVESAIKWPVAWLAGPDAQTVLLLHWEDYTDSSSSAHTVTNNWTSITTPTTPKFWDAIYINSTNHLEIPNGPDFDLSSGDFTIDTWVNLANVTTAVNNFFDYTQDSSNRVHFYTQGSDIWVYGKNAWAGISVWGSHGMSSNTWYHVALVSSAWIWTVYVDWAAIGSNSLSMPNLPIPIKIGLHNNSSTGTYYIDDYRISKWIARWTAPFTAPVETTWAWWPLEASQDNTWAWDVTPTTSAWAANLPAWTTEVILDEWANLDLSAWVAAESATTNNVGWTTIQDALNTISWGFSDANVDKVTLNSWAYWEDIIITAWEYAVDIPDGTNVYAPTWWDGKLQAPLDTTTWADVFWYIAEKVTQVWSDTYDIIFDKPIRIKLPAIWEVLYSSPWQDWDVVTEMCNDAFGDWIVFPNHCAFVSWNTTYIWTYHMTEYWVFDIDTWASLTEAQVEIVPGIVTISAPWLLDFWTWEVSTTTQTVTLDMATYSWGTQYFALQDLRWTDSWYYATIEISNLTVSWSTNKQIDAFNVYTTLTWTNSTITKLDWLLGQGIPAEVAIPSTTPITHIHIDAPLTILERNSATSPDAWILWKYWIQPKFDLNIPKFQELWEYSSTITYTLTER